MFPCRLYEVVGNVYGRPDAPFLFFVEVVGRIRNAEFLQHRLDNMCFLLYLDGRLLAACVFHVDDCLLTWSASMFQYIKNMESMFE